MNLYEDLIVLGVRFFYLFDLKNVGCSVFCVNNCFHEISLITVNGGITE